MIIFWDVVRVVDVLGAAWLLAWAVDLYRIRMDQGDQMGRFMALSYASYLLATLVGSTYLALAGVGFSPGLPFVTLGIGLGAYARLIAQRERNGSA